LALAQLKNVAGIDVSTPIKVSENGAVETPPGVKPVVLPSTSQQDPQKSEPTATTPVQTLPSPDLHLAEDLIDLGPEYRQAVDEALKTRPEVLESDAQISAAQKGIAYAQRSYEPSFGLQLQYVYQPDA